MLSFLENKKVIIKRYSSTLGEYNRPKKIMDTVGTYPCFTSTSSSNTAQKQPQKDNTTELTLYISSDEEPDVAVGDVLYIYEVDEYGELISGTELKAVADRPYKKRTHVAVPLLSGEEV